MGDTKLSTGRRNFLPKLYFTLNSGTVAVGEGGYQIWFWTPRSFFGNSHGELWLLIWETENFHLYLQNWNFSWRTWTVWRPRWILEGCCLIDIVTSDYIYMLFSNSQVPLFSTQHHVHHFWLWSLSNMANNQNGCLKMVTKCVLYGSHMWSCEICTRPCSKISFKLHR